MEYVFCDTQKELTETYEYLNRVEAFLGKKIIRLNPRAGFDHGIKVFGGYSETGNIEIGNIVTLANGDWENIYIIIAASRQVDDAVYARYKEFVEKNQLPPPDRLPVDLFDAPRKYTIGSLPATETPAKLAQFYFRQRTQNGRPKKCGALSMIL